MVRTIVTADKKDVMLTLPDSFLGKQIEIIAFVLENGTADVRNYNNVKTFTAVQLDTRNYHFDREEANQR